MAPRFTMTDSEFEDWRAGAEFFFNYLSWGRQQYDRHLVSIAERLGDCHPDDIPALHKEATVIGAKLREIIAISDTSLEDIRQSMEPRYED